MRIWQRPRPRHSDDSGATLIVALIIITVVAMVSAALLSFSDTSLRTTVALRDQAADVYAADGATQAVLNSLKTSGINCSNPSSPTGVTLGSTSTPFYVPASSAQGPVNAYAQCTPDPITGFSSSTPPPVTTTNTVTPAPVTSSGTSLGGGDPTLPTYGLLTTGNASGDFGVDFSTSAANKTICIENGSVGSNKDINATSETLAVRLTGTGTLADCTSGTGVSSTGSKLIVAAEGSCKGGAGAFTPTACVGGAPDVAPPAAPPLLDPITVDNPAPTCTSDKKYAAFRPGRYTTASALNNPCSGSAATFEWLSPGTYYFDFAGTTQWIWPTTLVGGTPINAAGNAVTGLNPTTATTLPLLANAAAAPNACADPATVSNAQGVELVFGGSSTVLANSSAGATAEICATSQTTTPPVAFYGLATAQSVPRSGGGSSTISAETMCTASGCGSNSLINTDVQGHAEIYIKGYVYAPNAQVILTLKNSTGQVFNWGIIVRNFRLSVNGSSPVQPFVQLPRPSTGAGIIVTTTTPSPYPTASLSTPPAVPVYTIRYVNVWICTVASLQASGQAACPHTSASTANVQARILTDASGVPLKVLSWNPIR